MRSRKISSPTYVESESKDEDSGSELDEDGVIKKVFDLKWSVSHYKPPRANLFVN